ncbi:hypothetical protein [Lentzea sp. CA-135723]|uniref:hypothetical protein n=1 Tax=Lentzea sp. CA-135723 TaxID=3239950 RepID=UPI003D92BB78
MEDAANTDVTRENAGQPRTPLWGPAPARSTPPPAAPVYEDPPAWGATEYVAPPAAKKSVEGKAVIAAVVVSFVAVTAVVVVSFMRGDEETPNGQNVGAAPVPVTSNKFAPVTTPPQQRYTTTRPSTSVSSSASNPSGYRAVTGPNGVFVSIPQTWTVTPGSQPTNHQAEDPATPGAVIRYGASASEARALYDAVASNESGVKSGYQRIKLAHVTSSTNIVEWEFLYTAEGVQRQAFARYWRRAGLDYIVYAASNVADWPQMQQVIRTMVNTAGPVA